MNIISLFVVFLIDTYEKIYAPIPLVFIRIIILLQEPKQRKIVDRRASKGRKIRYHVHEKLVNFMTPDDAELPEYTARIFANLFGHNRTTTE